ncbi:MAG: PIG-L family deacetylase [Planctomycetes bacterium]|nr:PIG-L family deacetylase [Planctomycetota bacterium]
MHSSDSELPSANDQLAPSGVVARRWRQWLRSRIKAKPEPSNLSRSAIVFAPHQDDEVLGCGGTIVKKIENGANISIVFMTDGRSSHADRMEAPDLVAMRRKEAIDAAQILGVAEDRVLFLDFPDGELSAHQADAVVRVAEILGQENAEEVFIPCEHDGPADHLATHQIVCHALALQNDEAIVYEYAVWFWHHWPWVNPRMDGVCSRATAMGGALGQPLRLLRDFNCCVDISAQRNTKAAALEAHESQMKRILDDGHWPILSDVAGGAWLESCTQESEIFRVHPATSL